MKCSSVCLRVDAKASDRVLVDCHYDSPYEVYRGSEQVRPRMILALNDNSTVFTQVGDKTSKLSTGDFNGIEYNRDYHCVRGTIPNGKTRLMLKIHFIVIPERNAGNFQYKWSCVYQLDVGQSFTISSCEFRHEVLPILLNILIGLSSFNL
jgi:hypothetical protein